MIELKIQRPYIDENGVVRENLEKHYAEDENGNRYYITQVETGVEYAEAVDLVPCKFTYLATNKPVEVEDDGSRI